MSAKIVDYYSGGNVFNSSLKDECLLIAIYVHHMYLTQPDNFKRIMSPDDGWLSPRIMDKLNDLVKCLENEFGQNVNGRGHSDEVALMRKLCAHDIDNDCVLKDRPKLAISQIRRDNSSNRLDSYPMYILKHSVNNKNRCRIEKLFSHGDEGVFSNDKPCILLLKDKHFYNVWGYDFLFNDIDTPKICSTRTCGSSLRYKKLFYLRCMVSYSNDSLHICHGRCHCCLGTDGDHVGPDDSREFFCDDCGRAFLQESCYEGHKAKKLQGEYKSYCDFLCTLRNCDECRKDFGLSFKCRHFGKKRRCIVRNVYFSNSSLRDSSGPSRYVKCGYCSDFYIMDFPGNHVCFLRCTDSMFGDPTKQSRTIHAHNVFFYDIESRLEEKYECRFQSINVKGDCITLRKRVMFDGMVEVEQFKRGLPEHYLKCMEVVKCKSHQPTLICVINSSRS